MTLKEIAQEIENDELFAERQAIDAVSRLAKIRKDRKVLEDDEAATALLIKEWFLRHPDESELLDLETGYRAFLRSGGESEVYDTVAAIKGRDKVLYKRLKELGALSEALDTTKVKEAIKDGRLMPGDIASFKHTRERSPSLMVEQTK